MANHKSSYVGDDIPESGIPVIYFKIIRAYDLIERDLNAHPETFASITCGDSTAQTIKRKNTNFPEWGMVFPFYWDATMRYASINIWDKYTDKDILYSHQCFLGTVMIPLFGLQDGDTNTSWYHLGERKNKFPVTGKVQIEYSCQYLPSLDLNLLGLFREIQRLPDFCIEILSPIQSSLPIDNKIADLSLTSPIIPQLKDTFPYNFPPIETEILEDISLKVHLVFNSYSGKLISKGILLLTNYRLLFVSMVRLVNHDRLELDPTIKDDFYLNIPTEYNIDSDMSMQIPLATIKDITTSENFNSTLNLYVSTIVIKSTDGKVITFGFDNSLDIQLDKNSLSQDNLTKQNEELKKEGGGIVNNLTSENIESREIFENLIVKNLNTGENFYLLEEKEKESRLQKKTRNSSISQIISNILFKDSVEDSEGFSSNPLDNVLDNIMKAKETLTHGLFPMKDDIKSINIVLKDDNNDDAPNHFNNEAINSNNNNNNSNNIFQERANCDEILNKKNKLEILNILQNNDFIDSSLCKHKDIIEDHDKSIDTINSELRSIGSESDNESNNEYNNESDVNQKRENYSIGESSTASDKDRKIMVDRSLGLAWYLFDNSIKSNKSNFEALSSYDGSPCRRFFSRLYFLCHNRKMSKFSTIELNSVLLNTINACNDKTRSLSEELAPISLPLGWRNDDCQIQNPSFNYGINNLQQHLDTLNQSHKERLISSIKKGWNIYNPEEEFARMGIPDSHWRLTNVNTNYELCETYPKVLSIPVGVDDGTLADAANFRSKKRFPTLSWRSPTNYCTICRSSQPMVGPLGNQNHNDQFLLKQINRHSAVSSKNVHNPVFAPSNSVARRPYVIIDARPMINAAANQAVGKGFETEKNYENSKIFFMNIPNIHVIRSSLLMFNDANNSDISGDTFYYNELEKSLWLDHIMKVLKASVKVVHCLSLENISVLIHCSDGWDRTSQLTSLSMLMLDPYYRTIEGFIVLIEKEWLSFGHKFEDRLGWSQGGFLDDDYSPIFVQFLDCCYQIMSQFSSSLEFNENLLLFILEHLHSGWFGNFYFNNQQDMMKSTTMEHSLSIWTVVLNNKHKYINNNYVATTNSIIPVLTKQRLILWRNYYSSWSDRIFRFSWYQDNVIDLDDQDESNLNSNANIGNNSNWSSDKKLNECTLCSKAFSMFKRRHHCRMCGLTFCNECSNDKRSIIKDDVSKDVRMCKLCAKRWDEFGDFNAT